jgi:hypothetical protein
MWGDERDGGAKDDESTNLAVCLNKDMAAGLLADYLES